MEHKITVPASVEELKELRAGDTVLLSGIVYTARDAACDDFDCRNYLLYESGYPWYFSKTKVLSTEEAAAELFRKYTSILTDESITIEYQGVENGG